MDGEQPNRVIGFGCVLGGDRTVVSMGVFALGDEADGADGTGVGFEFVAVRFRSLASLSWRDGPDAVAAEIPGRLCLPGAITLPLGTPDEALGAGLGA